MNLPEPPVIDGLEWRSPTTDDVPGLAAHTKRVHESERLEALVGVEFFEWFFQQPGIDLEHDVLLGIHDGTVVADAGAWLHTADSGARTIIWGEASPGHEHLKPFLIRWAEARARQRLADIQSSMTRVIRIAVEEHRQAHQEVIRDEGFSDLRVFADMARPLTDLPPLSPPAAGVEVVPWSEDLDDATRLASNESFADHWGSLPMTTEEFSGFVKENPSFRPDLSFVAVADGAVVSFSLCEVDEEDNEDRDTDDVYINRVGTVRSHRGRQLASHLIVRSLQAAAATGDLDRAALQVDEMSHTNATAVYERLGFETYARTFSFFKTL